MLARFGLFFIILSLGFHQGNAQDRYAVFFTYKPQTNFSLSNPEKFLSQKSILRRNRDKIPFDSLDFPVASKYILGLQPHIQEILYTSKWMNAAVVVTDSEKSKTLQALPYVKKVELVAKGFYSRSGNRLDSLPPSSKWANRIMDNQSNAYDFQNQLIGIPDMHKAGFTGKGVLVAIFDAGFPGMKESPAFAHLFANKLIQGELDVVRPWNKDVYTKNQHGTNVASLILANQPGVLVSGAYNAQVILALTEDEATEYKIEEFNWIRAAEFADSLGVDIINSSLGYLDFDDPGMNYSTSQLDGKSTYVSQGAAIAGKKGILVVNSVGNGGAAGNSSLVAPADAPGILSVGSVTSSSTLSSFSSKGPTADGRIKPELVAFGQGPTLIRSNGAVGAAAGTSFSAPQLAALAAGLWEAKPSWTKEELWKSLVKSGSQYAQPDNALGYGIPIFRAAYFGELLGISATEPSSWTIYPNPMIYEQVSILFGKELEVVVRLIDPAGRVYFDQKVNRISSSAPFEITLKDLPSGIFIIQLFDKKQVGTLKLIKP